MFINICIGKLFTVIISFSEEKHIIEKVELTEKALTDSKISFNDRHLEYIYSYFHEYFTNTINKCNIYKYIDLGVYSKFYRFVYEETMKIPPGSTITYAELACRISNPKATRAVGQCLSKNRYPLIIPCHRVVAKNGLGGFKYGTMLKKKILDREKLISHECSHI
jgi:methylated-DNA-[protein]-cysteine S-methyltransferase